MKTVSLHPDQLRANPWNSNVVSPENEVKLEASVERLGLFKPVLARRIDDPETGEEVFELIGGEHRVAAAARKGITEIVVVDLGRISDEKAREIGLADNARYGSDDATALAEIIRSLGGADSDIQNFLPYTDADVKSVFSSLSIDLDGLELDENFDATGQDVEPMAAKTHTIMRFKVPLEDGERITALITKVQKRQGYTESDALTNAGDALINIVYGARAKIEGE